MITGGLGQESDAVIPLVQQPGSGGLKIIARWFNAGGQRGVFNLHDGYGRITVAYPNSTLQQVPNCTLTVNASDYVLEINPPDPRGYTVMGFLTGSLPCVDSGTAIVEWYLDGSLIDAKLGQITPCAFTDFGRWP